MRSTQLLDLDVKSVFVQREDCATYDHSTMIKQRYLQTVSWKPPHIYRQLRGADVYNETARGIIDKFILQRTNVMVLGEVGRYKDQPTGVNTEAAEQSIDERRYHWDQIPGCKPTNQKAEIDDIDHPEQPSRTYSRRAVTCSVWCWVWFVWRTIRERMNVRDNEVFYPGRPDQCKNTSSVINSSSVLPSYPSSWPDEPTVRDHAQTSYSQRCSGGPGEPWACWLWGAWRHYSHYGRSVLSKHRKVRNIGLIHTLRVHAKINDMGFIETLQALP